MYDIPQYVPQGWQCPVCKRVYEPYVRSCDYCGEVTITVTNIGTLPSRDTVHITKSGEILKKETDI